MDVSPNPQQGAQGPVNPAPTAAADVSAPVAVPNLETALKELDTNKPVIAKSSIKSILAILAALKKDPVDAKNRRVKLTYPVQKHIVNVPGALAFLQAVGFVRTDDYLEIDAEKACDVDAMQRAEQLVVVRLEQIEKLLSEPPQDKPRVLCVGGCGFFGDPNTDNYCSQCIKKRALGVPVKVESAPKKCVKDCGFYGSDKFDGMCSTCFKKNGGVIAAAPAAPKRAFKALFKRAAHVLIAVRKFEAGKRPVQENKKRCWKCKKKVGITGIECKCNYVFCAKCRYPDEHDCVFNHKKLFQAKLNKENQLIQGTKLTKIEDA